MHRRCNMVSMAPASLFLPFLPLTAGQILLNNFLSDIPAVGIADDAVDVELVDRPRRWSMPFIGRYMVEPFFRSRPGQLLLLSTMVLIPVAFAIPYAPFAGVFGFVPLPAPLAVAIVGITVAYVAATELQKRWFYRGVE